MPHGCQLALTNESGSAPEKSRMLLGSGADTADWRVACWKITHDPLFSVFWYARMHARDQVVVWHISSTLTLLQLYCHRSTPLNISECRGEVVQRAQFVAMETWQTVM